MQKSQNRDLYDEVTNKIISALEKGTVPWQQPWGFGVPAQNHFSGHVYRGINALLFSFSDLKTPYFGTFEQITKAGGRVKKGSRAHTVYFSDLLIYQNKKRITESQYRQLPKPEKEKCKVVKLQRPWPVFNMSDVEGLPIKPDMILNPDLNRIEACDNFLKAVPNKPQITEEKQNRAYYNSTKDFIVMPAFEQFISAEFYYSVLFHELAHSTGHPSRLNRETLTQYAGFGTATYSKEELTAEITTSFVCNSLHIATPITDANTAAYIKNWLGVLRNDKRFVWEASTQAQRAFEYLTAH